jgi:hypothetical protein
MYIFLSLHLDKSPSPSSTQTPDINMASKDNNFEAEIRFRVTFSIIHTLSELAYIFLSSQKALINSRLPQRHPPMSSNPYSSASRKILK